jgi:hypothetical protein
LQPIIVYGCIQDVVYLFKGLVFIRLRRNTLQLAAGMKGKVNRAEAYQSEGGLIPLYHFNLVMATAQFRLDTPQLAAGSFIL